MIFNFAIQQMILSNVTRISISDVLKYKQLSTGIQKTFSRIAKPEEDHNNSTSNPNRTSPQIFHSFKFLVWTMASQLKYVCVQTASLKPFI